MPELAVLGVMAHAGNEKPERALEMAAVALAGCHGLADDRALYYSELIFASLDKVAKPHWRNSWHPDTSNSKRFCP